MFCHWIIKSKLLPAIALEWGPTWRTQSVTLREIIPHRFRCGGAMLCNCHRCTHFSLYSACYLHWIKLAAWSYRLGYLLQTIYPDWKEINDGDVCFIYHFIILPQKLPPPPPPPPPYLLDSYVCSVCMYAFLLPHQVRSSAISRRFVYRLQAVAKHNVLFSIGRI